MRTIVSLNALAFDAPGNVPDWVQLVPPGESRTVDGRGPYRLTDPQAVADASAAIGKLPIDENHSIDLAAPRGEASPARGWVVELQARDGAGIWGRVDWTATGRQKVGDNEYRGISPALELRADGTILRVLRASLTNMPNLPGLATLHHQQDPSMDLLTQLRGLLKLDAAADQAAVVVALNSVIARAESLATVAKAAGAAADATADQVVVALQAQAGLAGNAARMAAELVALQSQLTTVQNGIAAEKAAALVDGAIAGGKPIPASLRDHYVARATTDLAGVTTELNAMVALNAGGLPGRQPPAGGTNPAGLDADQAKIVALLGVDPEKFKANLAKQGLKQEAA